MPEFEVGDTIQALNPWSPRYKQEGIIVSNLRDDSFGVVFIQYQEEGTSLEGECEVGHGRLFSSENMILIKKKVTIYHICNPLCSKCMLDPREAVTF